MSTVTKQSTIVTEFLGTHWPDAVKSIEQSFRLTVDEAARLHHSKIARMIAFLPHYAGCFAPQRTAVAHLSTFMVANKGGRNLFDHNQDDDIELRTRLLPISHFVGGDSKKISRGMKLLQLTMIRGYLNDIEKDQKSGEYNPFLSGSWNPAEKDELIADLEADPDPGMDEVYSIADALEKSSFWWV